MHVDILAVGVHPDDVELSAAGTLLRHINMGYTVGLLDLTQGELGSRGSAEIRAREAYASAEKMGARFRENLGLPDGFIEYSPETLMSIIRVIRHCTPRIVLANALDDRHPDHGRAAKIVADACYYSGLVKIETVDDNGQKQAQHRPENLYHYIQDRNRKPDFVVDITGFTERKLELIRCFSSQFEDNVHKQYADEVKTPISGADFMAFLPAKWRSMGREANFEYAEGFETARYPGVVDLFHLK